MVEAIQWARRQLCGGVFDRVSNTLPLWTVALGIVLAAFFPTLGLAETSAAARAAKPRPNIILLMADDLGWGDVGFNGNSIIQTPQLDRMAGEGLVLNRFYAAAPVCSPTRGSVLTGRHPHRYGIDFANEGHLPESEPNLARSLKQAGYRTGHFGKWHLGTLTKTERDSNRGGPKTAKHYAPPQLRGFDVCFSTEAKVPTFDPLVRPMGSGNQWWHPLANTSVGVAYGTSYWREDGSKVSGPLEGDDSQLIANEAIKFIETAADDEAPFFAVVWFHAPHLPVVASEADRQPYREWDNYAQHYFGCITAMDRAIGSLRDRLEQLQLRESTLVMFCSDNGPEGVARKNPGDSARAPGSAGILRGRKRDLFEGGIRVPAVIVWPGVIAAGTTEIPVTTMDYAPTLFELLDLDNKTEHLPFDGISLLPLLTSGALTRLSPIVFKSKERAAVIEGRWKWVSYPPRKQARTDDGQVPTKTTWLFDLASDPSETHDVQAAHPDITRRLQTAYEQFLASSSRDRQRLKIDR